MVLFSVQVAERVVPHLLQEQRQLSVLLQMAEAEVEVLSHLVTESQELLELVVRPALVIVLLMQVAPAQLE